MDAIPGVSVIGIDPRALIMAPTRELAIQLAKECLKLCRGFDSNDIKICNLYGGTKRTTQRCEAFGADIIVGTPGRVADLLFPQYIGRTRCDYIVLDEADRMLDDGFEEINRLIIEKIQKMRGPKPISKVLTSATFPVEIQKFATNILRRDYMYAQCGILNAPSASVTQEVVHVDDLNEKYDELDLVLQKYNIGTEGSTAKALIFANTKWKVDYLGCLLSDTLGEACTTMHGDRSQEQREFALTLFATSTSPVLVATNVAARGLDIPAVDLIINFDCSDKEYFHDDYIHRIGRTGRVGRPGTAVTFVQENGKHNDKKKTGILIELMKVGNAKIPDWLRDMAENMVRNLEEFT
ncbi:unnamed protein product [Oikopleura dioica]|uniref:RNA helicase n=1 Tax=Oikopleura dioica TaxID=34765 RepID=E4XBF6_OIKDI|nr:unnamed protein product [Oikopleura dioica]